MVLQEVRSAYRGLQEVTEGYKGLSGVSGATRVRGDYKALKALT